MRFYLAQKNLTVGDFSGNKELILTGMREAAEAHSDVVLFPEMATTGYPPMDLLFHKSFIDANLMVLNDVIKASESFPEMLVILGFVERTEGGEHQLRNSAAVITDGKLIGTQAKTLLPTYDVFDEARYFDPACGWRIFDHKGVKIGVSVCEDLWDEGYETKVIPNLKLLGAEVIVNINASPYYLAKFYERHDLVVRHVKESGVPIIYLNLVGGQDELVFDGASFSVGKSGKLVSCGRWFEEDGYVVEYDEGAKDLIGEVSLPKVTKEEEIFGTLTLGTRDFVRKQGHEKVVIGLSGGIDSSIVAVIAANALGAKNVLGVAMPSKISSSHSLEDAEMLAKNLRIDFVVMEIEESVKVAEERYGRVFGDYRVKETRENLQARERGKILMEISNDQHRFVLATGNKTEYALGYATLYGDMAGALAPIGDLSKAEVYALAKWINDNLDAPIPARVLAKTPSAELSPGQVDPFDYDVVSPIVDALVEARMTVDELVKLGYPREEAERCQRLLFASEYKRWQSAPSIKVTPKAFGIGRKMPIVNKFVP